MTPHHKGPVIAIHNGTEIIECDVCGFRHILPLPTPEALEELYRDAFYQSDIPHYFKLSEEDRDWKQLEMADRYDQAEKLLEGVKGDVLDIGSGPGDFLAVGKARGWAHLGVEPSSAAAAYAQNRGLDVCETMLTADFAEQLLSTRQGKGFDFIHLSEVLEHILDPLDLLKTVNSLLAPKGVLCVSCPNDFNPLQEAVVQSNGGEKWWIEPHHHLNYFTFESLENTITKAGLTPKARSTNFPMELFLLFGDDYRGQPEVGRAMHKKRKRLDLSLAGSNPAVRQSLYTQLASAGLGRLAIVYAVKD